MTLPIFARHPRIGIDSNVLIYLLDGSGSLADKAAELLDGIAAGEAEGVMATLALAELCSGPARADDPALVERYADELRSIENMTLIALDEDIAVEAATIRGSTSLSLADAVHVASARHARATVFVTNDRRITSISRLEVAYLSDL